MRRRLVTIAMAGLCAVIIGPGCSSESEAPRSTEATLPLPPTRPGIPDGTVLRPSAGLTITESGTVIDGLDISGGVVVQANNVTIRRSRIRGDGFYVVDALKAVGTVIEFSEIDGLGHEGEAGSGGIAGPVRVRAVDIHGVENGVVPMSDSEIVYSYIHDLASPGEPHYDGVQIDGGQSNITISHNTISIPGQTAAVMINNYFGPISNIEVDGNTLTGGTYTVYADGQFDGGSISGVAVTNNRFGQHQFGYVLVRNNLLSASSGNVDDVTGLPIDQ